MQGKTAISSEIAELLDPKRYFFLPHFNILIIYFTPSNA